MNEVLRTHVEPTEYGVRTKFTEIVVRPRLLSEIPEILQRRFAGRRYAIITDSNVRELYGYDLNKSLRKSGLNGKLFSFPAGENSKTIETFSRMIDYLSARQYNRDSLIIALGGGVVGDVAGYVAADYKRFGLPYVQVPTTLLAQVDSSIGGKVGVNTAFGKNLIGAIHHPIIDLVDPTTVMRLPEEEYRNGLSELIKYGAIDRMFLRELEKYMGYLVGRDMDFLPRFVLDALIMKSFYVDKDPRDMGIRQVLNVGHTIAHAIEAASGYSIPHGKSLPVGIMMEGKVAVSREVWSERKLYRIGDLFRRGGIPIEMPDSVDRERVMEAAKQDKKRVGKVKLTLPAEDDPFSKIDIELDDNELRRLILS